MSRSMKKNAVTGVFYLIFTLLAVGIFLPIWVLFIASFKPGGDLLQYGLNLDLNISRMNLDNYILLFSGQHEYWR